MSIENTQAKVLTLVFTDLVESTALKREHGDDAAAELIARHREIVTRLAEDHGGDVVDWAGDGCFLTFPTPSAGVHFALDLQAAHRQQPDLPKLRIGVHMGEVSESRDSGQGARRVEGLAVDLASRIQSLALPGQILLSSEVFNSARQRLRTLDSAGPVAWRAHGEYQFKGQDEPVGVGEVGVEGGAPLTAPEGSEKARRAVAPTEEDTLGWRPAVGQAIPGRPHWVLEEQLGLGGFGEVWLASNVNSQDKHVFKFCFQPERVRGLKREVVLFRLLKERLDERDDIARVLDWEFAKPPFFIEAEYTRGGDLKHWADEKGGIDQVPTEVRLDLVMQVARALNAAHSAGVLHKDIKPGNVLIHETHGEPKACLTDFGIGLLTDPEALKKQGITATGLTETLLAGSSSSTSGTGMYLAPEILEGNAPSERSDIYALGVLLYQMVVGDFRRALAPGWEREILDPHLREDIARCVDGNPDNRFQHASEVAERLAQLSDRRVDADRLNRRKRRGKLLRQAALAGIVLAVAAVGIGYSVRTSEQRNNETWAREEGLPQIRALVDARKFEDAHRLADEVAAYLPGDPTLESYLNEATNVVSITTTPSGARVRYKAYPRVENDWIDLGQSPVHGERLSLGNHRVRIELEGYAPREFIVSVVDRQTSSLMPNATESGDIPVAVELIPTDEMPDGKILVDGGPFMPGLTGIVPAPTVIPPFFVDRTEVTNRAYKQFVDAGGYREPAYWKHPFERDGIELAFEEAVAEFTDATGQPGPAGWIQGDYPEDQADYPVRGVSWFEAAAYAEFRGEALPTVYHWSRMAHPPYEILVPLSPDIAALSRFGGDGPVSVGSLPGIGGSGAYDVAGNVREWCWNADTDGRRFAQGGAWSDPPYMYTLLHAQSPWDRFDTNGFRCVTYRGGVKGLPQFFEPVAVGRFTLRTEPLSEEVERIYRQRFSYSDMPLNPAHGQEPVKRGDAIYERVSIDATYGGRFDIHLYLPVDGQPPYKVSVFLPGINSLSAPSFVEMPWEEYRFIPKSGRALVKPILAGMYERGRGTGTLRLVDPNRNPELMEQWVKDVSRTIDYLETRDDIDTKDLGYIGFSLGAMMAPLFLGVEDRFDFAIMASGGLSFSTRAFQEESNPGVYIPGVTKPVLMMNGRHDYVFPYETAQRKLFDALGTPIERKKHVLYDAGHAPLPPVDVIRDTLDWLNTYQPVDSPTD